MRTLTLLLIAGLLALAGCGGDDETTASNDRQGTDVAMEKGTDADAMESKNADDAMARGGTEIRLADSEFGDMLFDSKRQAIYIFEKDSRDESVCYDECAEAWPPVFTDGEPVAGDGIDAELIGTTKRRDGKLQVTYAGQPLYYYAHEKPGEVKCHNINLNGGFWWVVGASGKRLA